MSRPVSSLSARVRTALGLSPRAWARTAEAAVLFHGFRLALRVVPFRRFRPVLGVEGPRDAVPTAPVRAGRGARAVRRALRRVSRAHPDTCLAQALAGRVMLRRRGLASTLSLGARHDGATDFHAWLRADGVLLTTGGGPARYAVLTTFYDPAPGARVG